MGIRIRQWLWELHFKFPFLSKLFYISDGLIHEEEDPRDWYFGSKTRPIINEIGNYKGDLPAGEEQKKKQETFACTNFAVANVIEIIAKVKYKEDWNKSDSFNAVLSGTNPARGGNSVSNAIDSVRKHHGMINEEDRPLPENFSLAEFYAFVTKEQKQKGLMWLTEFLVERENVASNAFALKEALKRSPVMVAVYAWYKNPKTGLYTHYAKHNHLTTLVNYKEGEYWEIFDSYKRDGTYIKRLAWNYPFAYCRVLYLNKKDQEFNQVEIDKLRERGLKYIMRVLAQGQILELTPDGLTYISKETWNNINVREKEVNKELIGVTEDLYLKLIR